MTSRYCTRVSNGPQQSLSLFGRRASTVRPLRQQFGTLERGSLTGLVAEHQIVGAVQLGKEHSKVLHSGSFTGKESAVLSFQIQAQLHS